MDDVQMDVDVVGLGASLAGGLAGAYMRPFDSPWVGFAAGSVVGAIAVGLTRMATQLAPQEVVVLDMGSASAADTRMPPPTGG